MPIYEYHCKSCDKVYEQLRRFSDADKDLECPDCKSRKVERMLSSFATHGCTASPGGGFT